MTDNLGGDYIYTVLTAAAPVTTLVSTSIYNARLIPETDTSVNTINFYMTGNFDRTFEFDSLRWSINCRSNTDYTAYNIAEAVSNAINRTGETLSGKKYFSTVSILPVIPPVDDADRYNVPVEVLIKRN